MCNAKDYVSQASASIPPKVSLYSSKALTETNLSL